MFIVETGLVPYKYETRVDAAIPQEYKKKNPEILNDVYFLTVALPAIAAPVNPVNTVEVEIASAVYSMDLAENISYMASENFAGQSAKIMTKAIARAVAKYITYRSVKGNDDNIIRRLLGATVNIVGAVTEQADIRAWLTLPDRIFVSHVYLEPGEYEYNMKIRDYSGLYRTVKNKIIIKKDSFSVIALRQ